MKKLVVLALLGIVSIGMIGCAKFQNDMKARGGLVGSYKGNYVVISQSGGEIMEVWVLKDVYVNSEENSDGWRFVDDNGNVVFIGGDVKVMRMDSSMDGYHEYHMEQETQTYREKFGE